MTLRETAPGMTPNPNLGKLNFPPQAPAQQAPIVQPTAPITPTKPGLSTVYSPPAMAPLLDPNRMMPPGGAPAIGSPLDGNRPTLQNAAYQTARTAVPAQAPATGPAPNDTLFMAGKDADGFKQFSLTGSGQQIGGAQGAAGSKPATPFYQADLRRTDSGDLTKTSVPLLAGYAPGNEPGFTETNPGSGVFQRGKNEFSDATGLRDSKFWARGPVSEQNMRAADALAARYGQGSGAAQAQYQREVEEANQRNAMGRAIESSQRSLLPGGGILSAEFQEQSNRASEARRMMSEMERRPGETAAAHNARVGMAKTVMERDQKERESVRGDGTTRRGQDKNFDATTRGQDMNYSATLRGQDMDLQGRVLPKQMEIQMQMAQRQRLRDVMEASRTPGADGKPGEIDPLVAQQLAMQVGDTTTAKAIADWVASTQDVAAKGNDIRDKGAKEFRDMFAGRATHLDKDGNPEQTKATEARMANDYLTANPGIVNAPRTKQLAAASKAAAEFGVRQRINNLDEGGWRSLLPTKILGFQREIKKSEGLPDASWWAGAKLSDTVGGIRGALSPNLEKGDQYITLRDGSQLNLGTMNAEELSLVDELIKQGNSLRGNK